MTVAELIEALRGHAPGAVVHVGCDPSERVVPAAVVVRMLAVDATVRPGGVIGAVDPGALIEEVWIVGAGTLED